MTEHRGITLTQLLDLWAKIESLADEKGDLPEWYQTFYRNRDANGKWDGSWRERKLCHKDTINLYDVVEYVVKPATVGQKCSYVELVASPEKKEEQKPRWFVSHWWGEPVKDFVTALKNHAKVRKLPDSTAYWVCAYANNQHDLASAIPADPKESSFYKAMQECDVHANLARRESVRQQRTVEILRKLSIIDVAKSCDFMDLVSIVTFFEIEEVF